MSQNKFAGKAKTIMGAERKLNQLGYYVWYHKMGKIYISDIFEVFSKKDEKVILIGTQQNVIDFYNRIAKIKSFI